MKQNNNIQGILYVIAAPSGAGKSSLVKALLESVAGLSVSISHTTRAARPGEQNGLDYHFVDTDIFKKMRENDEFLEHAQVFDNFYGTSKQAVQAGLDKGCDVILEIDWQGARQVAKAFTECEKIFILPPTRETLRQRLNARGQDDEATIERRMRDADSEMSHYAEFDYLVINDDFERAQQQLQAIIVSNRAKIERQRNINAQILADLIA